VPWLGTTLFLACKDVDGRDVNLGVAVLARFRDRELDDPARARLI
jgi:lysylphosphatidylglycerol synthetase-like protein (DUF2156 family)